VDIRNSFCSGDWPAHQHFYLLSQRVGKIVGIVVFFIWRPDKQGIIFIPQRRWCSGLYLRVKAAYQPFRSHRLTVYWPLGKLEQCYTQL